jgi:hypothetical protein
MTPPNLYADNASIGASTSPPGSWVVGNAQNDQTTSNIQSGVLYPYVDTAEVYHCPTDISTVHGRPGLTHFRIPIEARGASCLHRTTLETAGGLDNVSKRSIFDT